MSFPFVFVKVMPENVIYYVEAITQEYGKEKLLVNKQMVKNQGFEFDVNGNILEAKLYTTGINEVTEKLTEQKANMLYSSAEIFRNARYLYSTPSYDSDPNIYRWNYFYTPVKIP